MKRIYRLAKRKKNICRMLAAMFLFVFLLEMGSHVMIDSQDQNAVTQAASCSLDENVPARADCPDQRRQRQETKDLMDEMTTHVMLLNTMVIPHSGVMYRTGTNYAFGTVHVSTDIKPPFHPPELS
ncbi:MAG TPA: hypothetical protein VGI80_03330 [Pyrinomonadaceae bacterium]|jgi:hypothetical protein